MSIQLEKYNGGRGRHTCPNCKGRKEFTRYTDEDGNFFADNVGICNRVSSCKYHYPPRKFFADNPERKIGLKFGTGQKRGRANYGFATKNVLQATQTPKTAFDFIPVEHLKKTIGNYEQNAFVQFLFTFFPDCVEEINAVLEMYIIGTYPDYHGNYTCFPYIDEFNRICRAKLIRFNSETGKRLKGEYDTSSLPAKLKLKEDFKYKQVFFGEHLLKKFSEKPVALVEAEKSAVIASLYFPEFVWLGCNSKQWLKAERLQRFGNRKVILCPDADGYELWGAVATDARRLGLNVSVSDWIETRATDEQKAKGLDLADYLILQQKGRNKYNEYIDAHNLGIYEPDVQDIEDARLEREALFEYENTASA
jgi:hypothetical protein